jgi:hypothetical protein
MQNSGFSLKTVGGISVAVALMGWMLLPLHVLSSSKCFRISLKKRHAGAHVPICVCVCVCVCVEILISNSSVLNCKEDDPVGIEVPEMLFKELKLTLDT